MPRDLSQRRPVKERRPRVLAVYDDLSGCTLYRIFYPYIHLAEQGYPVYWVRRDDILRVNMADYDVVVLARMSPETAAEARRVLDMARPSGRCIIWETDDDLLNIPEWNPASFEVGSDRKNSIAAMLRGCEAITVTNQPLADRCRAYNPSAWILPDCVDPDHWKLSPEDRTVEGLTIGLAGGSSHQEDWKLVLGPLHRIAERYPEVKFVLVGYHPDYLIEALPISRLVRLNWKSIYDFPSQIVNIDIGLCPLLDLPFNQCKEPIKAMEYALAGGAVVASPTVYSRLITDRSLGFIARTSDDWERSIATLIEKPKLRRQTSTALRGKVLRSFNVHKRAGEWYRVYELIYRQFLRKQKAEVASRKTILETPPGFFAHLPIPAVG